MANKQAITKEVLNQLYVVEKKTSREIAEILGCGFRTILRRLHQYNLEVRNSGNEMVKELQDVEWLRSQYIDKQRSTIDIAKQLSIEPSLVSQWLKRHGVKARPRNQHKGRVFNELARLNMSKARKGLFIGDKNPNWRGALVNPNTRLRASHQSKTWSLQVRTRDGNKCVKCSSTHKLHAHHIKPWKTHPELRYEISNGMTLCAICHQKEHGFKFKEWVIYDEIPRALDTAMVKI